MTLKASILEPLNALSVCLFDYSEPHEQFFIYLAAGTITGDSLALMNHSMLCQFVCLIILSRTSNFSSIWRLAPLLVTA
jgi:hypothetical protein